MEEKRKAEKRRKEKDDGFFSVTLCQVIFSVIAVLSLLVIAKSGSQAAQNLKDDFQLLMSRSFLEGDFESTLKSIKDYLDSPAEISVFRLFSKDGEETASGATESEVTEPSGEKETSDKTDETTTSEPTVPETTTAETTTAEKTT